jgi:hypothetical protein
MGRDVDLIYLVHTAVTVADGNGKVAVGGLDEARIACGFAIALLSGAVPAAVDLVQVPVLEPAC